MTDFAQIYTPNGITYGRGYVYYLQYVIVWCTSDRQKFLDDFEEKITDYISRTARTLDVIVLSLEIMPDYICMTISCKPQIRLSDMIKVLKGNVARWLFQDEPELKRKLSKGQLWEPSYFISIDNSDNKDISELIDNYLKKINE